MNKILAFAAAAAVLFGGAAFADPVTSPANVRSGPSPKWRVIATLPAGTDVTVIDCGAGWKRDWCEIQAGPVHGFVAAGVLGTQGNNVLIAPVVTNNDVAIYKGPGVNFKIIGSIPENQTVNMGGCVAGNGGVTWCKVTFGGKTGYSIQSELQRQNSLFPM
ncbi:MAG: SH3 domain-containing protein [Methylocystis sp.]